MSSFFSVLLFVFVVFHLTVFTWIRKYYEIVLPTDTSEIRTNWEQNQICITGCFRDFSDYTFYISATLWGLFLRKHTWKSKFSYTGKPFITPFKSATIFEISWFFICFSRISWFWSDLMGLIPVSEKKLVSSMLRRKHCSKRGLNLKCVIRKVSDKPWL